jgi:aminopeptidase N
LKKSKKEFLKVLIFSGNFALTLKFTGTLNDKMHGFYRSKYVGHDGKEIHMATTQFESTYARMAFPCWDEPVYKTTFDVSLTVPEGKLALSNMPEVEENPTPNESGWKTVKFARTPMMSTYLCAFIVGDFEYLEVGTVFFRRRSGSVVSCPSLKGCLAPLGNIYSRAAFTVSPAREKS